MTCLAAKHIVNGIEQDLKGRAKVVRLSMMSTTGREVADRYDVKAIPTLVALDGEKNVIYRHTGLPNRREVVERVSSAD